LTLGLSWKAIRNALLTLPIRSMRAIRLPRQRGFIIVESLRKHKKVFLDVLKMVGIYMPFVTEEVYRNLYDDKNSLHVQDWPKPGKTSSDVEALGNFMKTIIKIFLLVLSGGLMIILIYFTELGGLIGSYEELLEDPTGVGTMETRLILWEGAFDMIQGENHAVRGLGAGAFWTLGPDYGIASSVGVSDDPEEMVKEGINPHSLYIDTFLHYGFPGLFLFLIVAISMLIRLGKSFIRFQSLKYRYLCLGLFCGLLAFFTHCIFDFTVFIISRFWLYLGLAAAITNIGEHFEASNQFEPPR